MTNPDAEKSDYVDELITELKEMAARIGAEFVPDPRKIKAFREFHNRDAQKEKP
jgi:hypothetical protein